MNRLIAILLFAAAATAHAAIGESRAQITKRFSARALVSDDGGTMTFHSRNLAKIVFGDSERSEVEFYYIATPYDQKSLLDTINMVIGRRLHFNKVPGRFCFLSDDGNYAAAMLTDTPSGYQWGVAVGLSSAVTANVRFDDQRQPTVIAPAPSAPVRDKADCSVVASETFNRLKGKSSWVATVSVTVIYANGTPSNAHEMCVWKDTSDQHLKIYVGEGIGTMQLDTSSEKIEDIENACNAALERMHNGDRFRAFHFIDQPVTAKTVVSE